MKKIEDLLEIQKAHFEIMAAYYKHMALLLQKSIEEKEEPEKKGLFQEEAKCPKEERISQSKEALIKELDKLKVILKDPFLLEEDQIYKTNEPMKPSSEIWEEEHS